MKFNVTSLFIVLSAVVLSAPACTLAPRESTSAPAPTSAPPAATSASPVTAAAEDDFVPRPFVVSALLYLPNRILDAFDFFRFGVDVGPGVGIQAQATEFVQATAMGRLSAGVGYQTLRHLPVKVSAESLLGVGPLGVDGIVGLGWYRPATDFQLGFHFLLLGMHVGIDPVEILDFPAGFIGFDLADDDF